jgi:hypothetical protein
MYNFLYYSLPSNAFKPSIVLCPCVFKHLYNLWTSFQCQIKTIKINISICFKFHILRYVTETKTVLKRILANISVIYLLLIQLISNLKLISISFGKELLSKGKRHRGNRSQGYEGMYFPPGTNNYPQRAGQMPHPAARRIATNDGYKGRNWIQHNNINLP